MAPKPFESYSKQFLPSNSMSIESVSEPSYDNSDLFFVSTYSDFDKLAHGPRGTEAKNSLYVYRFNPSDGSMLLLNIDGDKNEVINPAFSRFHPRLNVVYTCTEDIENNGVILAYSINADGALKQIGKIDAGGTSTCYITLDKAQKHLLAVNYWDSTLCVIPLSTETGEFTGPICSLYDPKHGNKVASALKKLGGCNHSNNDDSTIKERQKDPHSHALVLDPFVGCIAYVPDLGKDLIREFLYDKENGTILTELNTLPSGLCTGKPDGPRYFEFHPTLNVAYVVNELSSTIAVFAVNKSMLKEISKLQANSQSLDKFTNHSSLQLIQSISTVPNAFPRKMNTCGRVCVHRSGHYVIVSNRGHESIAIFRVYQHGPKRGHLKQVGFFHTRGETPRHFQFDSSGQYLIVANQDSNTIAVFSFNLSSGEIKYTGNEYRIPSPNFVCCCSMNDSDKLSDDDSVSSSIGSTESISYMEQTQGKHLEQELKNAQFEIMELRRQLSTLTNNNNDSSLTIGSNILTTKISTLTEDGL